MVNHKIILPHIDFVTRSAAFLQTGKDSYIKNNDHSLISCKTYNFTCLEWITMAGLNVPFVIKLPSISIDSLFASRTQLLSKMITTMACSYKIVIKYL